MIIYYHCTRDSVLLLSFLLTCHPTSRNYFYTCIHRVSGWNLVFPVKNKYVINHLHRVLYNILLCIIVQLLHNFDISLQSSLQQPYQTGTNWIRMLCIATEPTAEIPHNS